MNQAPTKSIWKYNRDRSVYTQNNEKGVMNTITCDFYEHVLFIKQSDQQSDQN